ncbi:MAG: 50S ribosomal protein L22 [Candidatus Pacebacteria bacterium]|nr:50S ribosomal protein L22 [Candidatus Paceibacterota bacterium]
MEVKAHLRNLRISSRKVRLVVNLIRNMSINDARIQLSFLNKKSAEPVLKLLNSAVANASNNFNINENSLYISSIFVNDGMVLKRWIPRAMGRASAIRKRSSHITIILDELKSETKIDSRKDEIQDKKEDLNKDKTVQSEKVQDKQIEPKKLVKESIKEEKIDKKESK